VAEIPTEALEAAALTVAGFDLPSHHDRQFCPVWTERAPVGRCKCWILSDARVKVAAAAPYLIAYGVRKAAVKISVQLEDLPLDDHSATYIRLDYAIDVCRAVSDAA